MINLLPNGTKTQLRAAHTNVILVRYIIVLIFAVGFLTLISGGLYFILADTKDAATQAITDDTQQNSDLLQVQNDASAFRTSVAEARSILDGDIRYSKLLTSLGTLMPEGVIIDSLDLSPDMFTQPTTLTVFATSSEVAQQFRTALAGSTLVSSQPTLQSSTSSSEINGYTTAMTISVTFSRAGAQ